MVNSRTILMAALLAAFAAGCANTTTTWSKKGSGMKQATADLKECAGEGQMLYDAAGLDGKPVAHVSKTTYAWRAGAPFEKCMTGKGYSKAN